jgi:thymidylate kinase
MTEARRPRRRPLTVSFSGLDGAGKTHQIESMVNSLAPDRSVEVVWVPFKIWPESLLNRLPADFRSRLGPRRRVLPDASATTLAEPVAGGDVVHRSAADVPRAGVGHRVARAAFWWTVGTFAAVSGGLSLRRRARANSADVLVLDRYRLDTLVKLQFWYADVPGRWLAQVVRLLAPAPDAEFLLRVDAAVAFERKPEQWSVEQLSTQARVYDVLAAELGHVVALDGGQSPEAVATTVASHVRNVLHEH